jgi:hypothetical protein
MFEALSCEVTSLIATFVLYVFFKKMPSTIQFRLETQDNFSPLQISSPLLPFSNVETMVRYKIGQSLVGCHKVQIC